MKKVCMIPARLGSQRLKKKNLLTINNASIVKLCAEKCLKSSAFDEVYINSESDVILDEAPRGCLKYKRSNKLADSKSTSEDFIRDFCSSIKADYLFQIHSIAPLITIQQINSFVENFIKSDKQVGFTYERIILESLMEGCPVNFSFEQKKQLTRFKRHSCYKLGHDGVELNKQCNERGVYFFW